MKQLLALIAVLGCVLAISGCGTQEPTTENAVSTGATQASEGSVEKPAASQTREGAATRG